MSSVKKHNLGILAYGSLINDPGEELSPYIIERISCQTPFNVEYDRISASRDNAPTLVPSGKQGSPVAAVILVLSDEISIETAQSMLYRRELHLVNSNKQYNRPQNPGRNSVIIEQVNDYCNVQAVLYTAIPSNMGSLNTPSYLAYFAISSILDEAGERGEDGIRYLQSNIDNGIVTANTEAYEKAILEETHCKTLAEAIEKLDKMRPANLERKRQMAVFEKEVIELSDLINQYGIENTKNLNHDTPETLQKSMVEHREEFMEKVHEGWKLGQKLALKMILEIQDAVISLKTSLKEAHRSKNKQRVSQIKSDIEHYRFKESIVRHLMDTIAWQLLQGQLYISRRLYQEVEGDKILKDSNIESAVAAVEEINKKGSNFALISDLTGYIQSGDLLCLMDKKIVIVELKEGKKNNEIIKVLREIKAGDINVPAAIEKYSLSQKDVEQMDRQAKQIATMENIVNIVNTDYGVEPGTDRPIKIVTPNEATPRFTEELHEAYMQLEKRNLWGYTVVRDCLHIGIYKGPFRFIGAKLLKAVGGIHSENCILINYLTVLQSLNKPFFTLPFEREHVFDILFGRMTLYFLLDLDAFIALAPKVGMNARWATVKETNKAKPKMRKGLFIYKGSGIMLAMKEDVDFKEPMFLAVGSIHKIIYEHIDPAYVMYSFHYLSAVEEIEARDEG
jgi:hypothetical protein